jgi:hypothetical protein
MPLERYISGVRYEGVRFPLISSRHALATRKMNISDGGITQGSIRQEGYQVGPGGSRHLLNACPPLLIYHSVSVSESLSFADQNTSCDI